LREVRDALSFATEGTELRTQRTRKMMRDGAIDNAPFCFLGEVATVKAAAGLPHSKGEDAGLMLGVVGTWEPAGCRRYTRWRTCANGAGEMTRLLWPI